MQAAVDAGALGSRATVKVAPPLGAITGAYEPLCLHACLEWIALHKPGRLLGPLWQRDFYEGATRDETDLDRIRQYSMDNPALWDEKHENPLLAAAGMR